MGSYLLQLAYSGRILGTHSGSILTDILYSLKYGKVIRI